MRAALAAFLVVLCLTSVSQCAFVKNYTVTTGDFSTPDWGAYQSGVCTGYNKLSQASTTDDGVYFDAVDMQSLFFDDDSTPWYASPNGFLAATSYPMCSFFCSDASIQTLYGSYAMNMSRGSDWPILALFTADLNPLRMRNVAQVCAQKDSSGASVTVEYNRVPLEASTSAADDALTAQAVIYANGTFIFRYHTLPASVENSSRLPVAGVSAAANRFVASPVAIRAGLSLRFEPVLDTCSMAPLADSEASCAASSDCLWCTATAACMHADVAVFRCPAGTFTAGTSIAASRYTVEVDYDGTFDFDSDSYSVVYPGYTRVVDFDSHFLFPFFDMNPLNDTGAQGVTFTSPATLLVDFNSVQCNPLLYTCVNGNYSNAILLYQSAAYTSVKMSAAMLTSRQPGTTMCPSTADTNCVPAWVARVAGIAPNSVLGISFYQSVNTQVFVDMDGVIDIVIIASSASRGERLYVYPPALVGVVRHGLDDPESLVIPAALLRSGVHIRYTLKQPSCPNCGAHGRCDGSTATCVCDAGFTGSLCDACTDANHYGANCEYTCPACAQGHCDSGTQGHGVCLCPDGMGGDLCATPCATTHTTAATCSAAGGFLRCGACVCYDGWHGAACDEPDRDPCEVRGLGGCAYCAAQEGCSFCYDYTCFSPSLSGTARGRSCSYASPFPQESLCSDPVMAPQYGPSYDITLGLLLGVILLLAIGLFVVVFCLVRHRRNVYDVHVVHATGGAPDFAYPRREREVTQMAFVPRTKLVQSRYVLAIPLKQISLKKLYEKQRGIDKSKKTD